MELEGAVEFLLDEHRTHLCVIGALVTRVLGDCPSDYHGDELMDMLYTGRRHEAGFRQGKFVIWRRPARRWTQFGSRKDLLDLAALHGVKVNLRDPRE